MVGDEVPDVVQRSDRDSGPGSGPDVANKGSASVERLPGNQQQQQPTRRRYTEDFLMTTFKIKRCPQSAPHVWRECPFAHVGEVAVRRHPSRYLSIACPASKAARQPCKLGDSCPFAHSPHEFFLHPSRYRTQMCMSGSSCTRPICYFAHSDSELRPVKHESLTPEQLKMLFAARISAITPIDASTLEATIQYGILGELPPIPAGVLVSDCGDGALATPPFIQASVASAASPNLVLQTRQASHLSAQELLQMQRPACATAGQQSEQLLMRLQAAEARLAQLTANVEAAAAAEADAEAAAAQAMAAVAVARVQQAAGNLVPAGGVQVIAGTGSVLNTMAGAPVSIMGPLITPGPAVQQPAAPLHMVSHAMQAGTGLLAADPSQAALLTGPATLGQQQLLGLNPNLNPNAGLCGLLPPPGLPIFVPSPGGIIAPPATMQTVPTTFFM